MQSFELCFHLTLEYIVVSNKNQLKKYDHVGNTNVNNMLIDKILYKINVGHINVYSLIDNNIISLFSLIVHNIGSQITHFVHHKSI